LFQSLRLGILTVLIAVPLGVSFAIGIDRWHGRPATAATFVMLLSFVMPEIILGISLFLVFRHLLTFVELGTTAQIIGLVTYQVSYPVIIVRARLLTIGREYEEAASDLGAPPRQAIRRVLLPLLYPAIFASAALVFADTIDDFVTVKYLSGPATSEPLSVKIYNFSRAEPTPAVNAAATFLLVTTTLAILIGYLAYRRATKGQRTGGVSEFANV
jgi:spermidine/putrescine transport system permease protein